MDRKRNTLYGKMVVSFVLLCSMVGLVVTGLVYGLKQESPKEEKKKEALIYVDEKHPVPENYQTTFIEVEDQLVSSVMKEALRAMREDAKKEGILLEIERGYDLHSSCIGREEHKTGLAVDFKAHASKLENSNMLKWLGKNSYRYGFICRYEESSYHYRFIGVEHATKMVEENLNFKEYLESRKKEGI